MILYELLLLACGGFAVFDGAKYGNFNMIYHNETKIDMHLSYAHYVTQHTQH
jgi:hypothetical protein